MHEGKLKANLVNHHLTQEQVMEAALRSEHHVENTSSEIKIIPPAPAGVSGFKGLNLQVFVMIAAIVVIMLFFTGPPKEPI